MALEMESDSFPVVNGHHNEYVFRLSLRLRTEERLKVRLEQMPRVHEHVDVAASSKAPRPSLFVAVPQMEE